MMLGGRKHIITLFTRPNCPICNHAKEVLSQIPSRLPTGHSLIVKEVDIAENIEANKKHKYEVPIGFINEKEVFRFWVNENK